MKIKINKNYKTIYLTEEEFNELEDFKVESGVPNNEGTFKKIEINGQTKLIKQHIRGKHQELISYNINMFLKYKDILLKNNPHLVLPEEEVKLENSYSNIYTLELIEGIPLQYLLRCDECNFKIKLLQNLGSILNKFGYIPNFPYNLYFGDLHEGNIILDTKRNLRIVDTTSLYIENTHHFLFENPNDVPESKYLEYNKEIKKEKYHNKYKQGYLHSIIPSKDSDIFCYIIIILNTLAQLEASMLNYNSLLNYLDYLENIGIDLNFLYSVTTLFSLSPNINPYKYISSITNEQINEAHYLKYQKRTNIDLTTCI